MSKIAKASANKKHNVPDYKVIGKVIPDIIKKINQLVVEKKANDVINIIDYINNRIQTKITNVSVDTWSEALYFLHELETPSLIKLFTIFWSLVLRVASMRALKGRKGVSIT